MIQCYLIRQAGLLIATAMTLLPLSAQADRDPVAPLPALGADWMPVPDAIDTPTAPDRWPLSDATAAGLDDMVHESHDGAHIGPPSDRIAGSAHAGRVFRTLSGGYLVVPVLKIHLGHRG